jgi:hypothetical protein
MPQKQGDKKILNFWAEPKILDKIDELQKGLGVYKSEVMRQAIAEMHERYKAGQYDQKPLEDRVAELEKRLATLERKNGSTLSRESRESSEAIPKSKPSRAPSEPQKTSEPAKATSKPVPKKQPKSRSRKQEEKEQRDAIIWQICRVYTTDQSMRTEKFKEKVAGHLNKLGYRKRYGGEEKFYDAKSIDNRISELNRQDESYLRRISEMEVDLGGIVEKS